MLEDVIRPLAYRFIAALILVLGFVFDCLLPENKRLTFWQTIKSYFVKGLLTVFIFGPPLLGTMFMLHFLGEYEFGYTISVIVGIALGLVAQVIFLYKMGGN